MQYNPGSTPDDNGTQNGTQYNPNYNPNNPNDSFAGFDKDNTSSDPNNTGYNKGKAEEIDPVKTFGKMMDQLGRVVETGANQLGNLINNAAATASTASASLFTLPIDMYETPDSVIVKAGPIIGLAPQDLDVTITLDTLTIKGDIKADPLPEGAVLLRQERKVGPFTRTVKVPRALKNESAQADFKNGLLIITLPKVEEAKPKTIRVDTVL